MFIRSVILLTAVLDLSVCAVAGDSAPKMSALPTNTWTKVDSSPGGGPAYSRPVFAPERGQLLHWITSSQTMRAFDAKTGKWIVDPAPEKGNGPAAFVAKLLKVKDWNWRSAKLLTPGGYQQPMDTPCWDSKRKRLVITMNRLMFAYDPAAKKWADLDAKSVIYDRSYPGGPPVFGAGACYDPVNDEIVMFPHWTYHSRYNRHTPRNIDRRDVDGRISAHLGTMVFSFKDKTWRRVAGEIGSKEARQARKNVLDKLGRLSQVLDRLYALRRKPDQAEQEALSGKLRALHAEGVERSAAPPGAPDALAKAMMPLRKAAEQVKAGKLDEALTTGAAVWRSLDELLSTKLAVEPPPRCATAMVYHPEKKCIVMFGGRDGLVRTDIGRWGSGALNDTWAYDCTTRTWRELKCPHRPPTQQRGRLFYDLVTKSVFLVTFQQRGRLPHQVCVWTLDVDKGNWSLRLDQKWTAELNTRDEQFEVGYDSRHSTLVFLQRVGRGKAGRVETWAMPLDFAKAPTQPAPEWDAPPAIKPQTVPPDDPEWIAKLKTLPANTWVLAKPPREVSRRDWGNVAVDPVRGHVYYFGGGHSTYQANDVAIYVVGANRWSRAAGDHNDLLPPTHWGGCGIGFRGGEWAHHQRNNYVAVDGRMYVGVDPPWFYDVDRGGVWRQTTLAARRLDKGAVNESACHVVSPDGRVMALLGRNMVSRMARPHPTESGFSSYSIYTNELTIRKVNPPFPNYVREHRPLCFMPDKNQIFFYEHASGKEKLYSQGTWVYDIKTNKWTKLEPKTSPFNGPGGVHAVEYLPDQDAVFAVLRNRNEKKRQEQWVYSFKHNAWKQLPVKGPVHLVGPYGQLGYVAKYGVLVNVPKEVSVMRLDIDKLDWE